MPTARWHQGADFARRVLPTSLFVRSFDSSNALCRGPRRVAGAMLAVLISHSTWTLAQDASAQVAVARDAVEQDQAIESTGDAPAEVVVHTEPAPATGSKTGEPRADVPATVNVVDRKVLRERGQTDLISALTNVPGMNAVLTYGGFNEIQIRGFSDFVILRDGVRDDRSTVASSSPWTNLADIERVEVLKGPASVLYGFGGIGGVINLVRTRPSEELHYDASVTVGGPEFMRRASLGVGGPLIDGVLLYRVDVGMTDDLSFRRDNIERTNLSGAIELRPSAAQRLLLRANVSRDRYDTDAGIPTEAGSIPAGIDRSRRFNMPQDAMAYRWFELAGEYSLRVAPGIQLTDRVSYVRNPYTYLSTESLSLGSADGGPPDRVDRGYLFFGHDWRPLYNQLELQLERKLLVEHRFLVGYEFGWMHSRHPGASIEDTNLLPVGFEPGPDPQPEIGVERDRLRVRDQITHGVYAHDTLTLLPELKLVLGIRADSWQRETRTDSRDPESGTWSEGTTQKRDASAVTWRAGLVYQPLPWLATYGSVATAFVPIAVVPADGRQLDPERGRQLELGARLDLLDRRLHLDIAGYDIRKSDVVVARPEGLYEQAGRVTSRGVELNAELDVAMGLSVRTGYAFTRARYKNFVTGDQDYSGGSPPFVPEHSFTFWGTYRHESGLGAGIGARALSVAYADPANAVPLPAYGVLDAALFYRWAPVELALNVNNAFDNQRYLAGAINDSQVYPGAPRVVLVSLRVVE